MLTLESKFSEYVDALKTGGACEKVVSIHEEMLAKNPKLTVGEVYKGFSDDPSFEQGWAYWVLELMGKELDVKIREIAINKIKDPMLCLQLLTKCDFLTEAERILLKSKYTGKLTAIQEPMDAARLYIDCAPVLTEAESLSLKAVFEGKLPTVEKELRDGIVTRATAEVAP